MKLGTGLKRRWRRGMLGTQAVLVGIGAGLIGIVVLIALMMNAAARDAEAMLIDRALTSAVDRVLGEQKAVALWGQAREEAERPVLDRAWLDRQLGDYLAEAYGHDEVHLLDATDRPIYDHGGGTALPPSTFEAIRPAVRPLLAAVRSGAPSPLRDRAHGFRLGYQNMEALPGARAARWTANIVRTGNGPAIVAVMTVLAPADPAAGRPPLLVDVVRIDNAWLGDLGRSLDLADLRFHRPGEGTGAPFLADDGTRLGTLSWTGKRPGRLLLTRVLPVVTVLLVAALLVAGRVVSRLAAAHARLTEQEAQARLLAMHDPLSGLPNRRHFMDELTRRLLRRRDDPAQPAVTVVYLDVDRFKEVNDAIGHAAGDALVQQIGPRIAALLGPDDLLARIGGDEFAVVAALGEQRSPDDLGRALMSAFGAPFQVGALPLTVSASVGIATAADGETDPNRPIQDADISLYRAKDDGRGRYAIFADAMAAEVRERHLIETELRAAIGTPAISMRYQPIFSVRSNAIIAVEALVRWDHPGRGPVSPARFIPIAEMTGLMPALGDDILSRVLQDAPGLPNIDLAINLSTRQLHDRALPQAIEDKVRAHRVDPRRIVLEITETALLDADGVVDEVLADLRSRGFRLALDDFGTGFSSLSHLQRFHFDKIKIDSSFVSAGALERQRPIIQAIVTIGRGFDMEIVAEGIETAAEFAFIQSLGCHAVQGYWLAKPLTYKEARSLIRKRAAELARLEPAPLEFGDAVAAS